MSATQTSISKSELDVVVRKMTFPYEDVKTPWFFDGNSLKSTLFAALSSTFPPGEAEFIASVRLFRDQIKDEKLLDEIRAFIGQEAHHSLQHKKANETLRDIGLDAVKLEKILERQIEELKSKNSPKVRLAFTCGAEHLTAIMADHFLNNPQWMEGLEEPVKDLLMWHAVEEIEHKSVAYDTYMEAVGDKQLLNRTIVIMTIMFSTRISVYMAMLLWQNRKVPSFREIRDFGKFMFGKKGLVSSIRKPYMEYFRKDFHPWDHQNQDLVDAWKAMLTDEQKAMAS